MNARKSLPQSLTTSGFTLIELLVTVTIMVILLGGAIAGYFRFEQVQKVQQVARDVQQLFTETRRKAQIRDQRGCVPDHLPPGGSIFGSVRNYQIKIMSGSPAMTVEQKTNCEIAGDTDPPILYPPPNRPIPSSVTISPVGLELTYTPLATAANLQNCASDPCRVIVTDGSISYGFTVSPGGQIGSVQKL